MGSSLPAIPAHGIPIKDADGQTLFWLSVRNNRLTIQPSPGSEPGCCVRIVATDDPDTLELWNDSPADQASLRLYSDEQIWNFGVTGSANPAGGNMLYALRAGAGFAFSFWIPEDDIMRIRTGLQVGTDASGAASIAKTLFGSAVLDFPSIAAQSSADIAVSKAGVIAGDIVQVSQPTTLGVVVTAHCFVDGTITVRAHNYSAAPVDIPSSTYRFNIIRGTYS